MSQVEGIQGLWQNFTAFATEVIYQKYLLI